LSLVNPAALGRETYSYPPPPSPPLNNGMDLEDGFGFGYGLSPGLHHYIPLTPPLTPTSGNPELSFMPNDVDYGMRIDETEPQQNLSNANDATQIDDTVEMKTSGGRRSKRFRHLKYIKHSKRFRSKKNRQSKRKYKKRRFSKRK